MKEIINEYHNPNIPHIQVCFLIIKIKPYQTCQDIQIIHAALYDTMWCNMKGKP
jgi:hypothetical protein